MHGEPLRFRSGGGYRQCPVDMSLHWRSVVCCVRADLSERVQRTVQPTQGERRGETLPQNKPLGHGAHHAEDRHH